MKPTKFTKCGGRHLQSGVDMQTSANEIGRMKSRCLTSSGVSSVPLTFCSAVALSILEKTIVFLHSQNRNPNRFPLIQTEKPTSPLGSGCTG